MTAAAWHPDPTGKHELRYWDGSQWTEHVSDGGNVSADPLQPPAHAEEAQQSEQAATGDVSGEESPLSDSSLDRTMMAGDPLNDPLTDPMPQKSAEAPADAMDSAERARDTPGDVHQARDPTRKQT